MKRSTIVEIHQKNDWYVTLWSSGVTEVCNGRGVFLVFFPEDAPKHLPKYVQRMVVEQRDAFLPEIYTREGR